VQLNADAYLPRWVGRPESLDEDAKGGVDGAAAAQEIPGQMQVDIRPLGQLPRCCALVPDALEFFLAPEEDALGFRVEFDIELGSRHHVHGFGRDPNAVVPHLVDFRTPNGRS
jgi:hypothetical protein